MCIQKLTSGNHGYVEICIFMQHQYENIQKDISSLNILGWGGGGGVNPGKYCNYYWCCINNKIKLKIKI
jgi:hypothetical protein